MKRLWKQGYTLPTKITETMDDSVKAFNDKLEATRIYSDFKEEDQGRSRQLVCVMNELHPEFEQNVKLVIGAKQMFNSIVLIAARDGYEYLYDLVEQVTGERWSTKRMNEEADKIRKETDINF